MGPSVIDLYLTSLKWKGWNSEPWYASGISSGDLLVNGNGTKQRIKPFLKETTQHSSSGKMGILVGIDHIIAWTNSRNAYDFIYLGFKLQADWGLHGRRHLHDGYRPQTPTIAKIQVVQVSSLIYTYTQMRGVGTHSRSQEDVEWVQQQMTQQDNQQVV